MSDNFVYNTSLEEQRNDAPFVARRQVYILDDNNSSNYNGVMTFNTSSTSNSGLYADWKNSFLSIPVIVELTSATDVADKSALSVVLKNSTTSLIHSMSIEYNSNTIIQTTNFSNHYITWKQICEMSEEDVRKWGDVYNIHPDNGDVQTFEAGANAVGTAVGRGSCNNIGNPAINATNTLYKNYNEGISKRQANFSFDPSANTNSLTAATCNKIAKNYYQIKDAKTSYWYYVAQIRLSDLADFFTHMPLCKNAFFKMTFNLNTSKQTIVKAAGGTMNCTQTILQHGSSAVMINSSNFPASQADATYSLELAVGRTSTGATHPVFSNARLYVDLYTLDATHEQQLLSFKNKVFEYNDIYQYSIQTTSVNVNTLLTNGLSHLKGLLIIPYIGTNSNPVSETAFIAPYQSPFACEPAGNTSRDIVLTNINVLVGGAAILQQAQLYDYEQYVNELSSCEAINGGLSRGLNNGLISFEQFQLNKRFYFFDLSRRMPAEQGIPKSVQLQCQIEKPSYMTADSEVHLMCFLVYSKKFGFDLESGVVLDI